MLNKLRGSLVFILGYILSPLSWWNDLFFNLPIAYFIGYIFSLFHANLFLPFSIAGYWVSNVAGFLLMQFGATDVLSQSKRNFKKELLIGLIASTVYI
ncbi:hypothetical protein Glo7428_3477 [Gloeocapsa sp. PCC 7428]|uniref:hypothetical protein n=1 Tax=Gloeocapsa sp. PCC 7428 TaxID=1173026 RepID=UPI0002A61786|nr:hypothetical protein [Gloeocapsa sp. PCC 7428]AFZ31950.1 hypothetical protein Glo7428_3477 [Gloeocapsa sp. PCC 7428]